MKSLLYLASLTAAISAVLPAAPIMVLDHTANVNASTGIASFSLLFDRAPDISASADSFQYFFLGNQSLPYPARYDSVVRCCEQVGILVVRDPLPSSNDPLAGGWGPVRGTVPFTLNGATLSFSATLTLFSDRNSLLYELLVASDGRATQLLIYAPEPLSPPLVALGLIGIWTISRWISVKRP
jgi:hypothetical protein